MRISSDAFCAVSVITGILAASTPVNAQLFSLRNTSEESVSVGVAVYDDTCASEYRNVLWTNLERHDSTDIDIDLTHPILVSVIIGNDHGFQTVPVSNVQKPQDSSLQHYDWYMPLTGSNQCSLFGWNPDEQFGYLEVSGLDDICPAGVTGVAGLMIRDGEASILPGGDVGCIVLVGGVFKVVNGHDGTLDP